MNDCLREGQGTPRAHFAPPTFMQDTAGVGWVVLELISGLLALLMDPLL